MSFTQESMRLFGVNRHKHPPYDPATPRSDLQWTEPFMMTTEVRNRTALPAFIALCLGVAAIFSVPIQAAEASQTMTNTLASAASLSSQQQAIPLIAAFMATSDMPNLNTALNQGLDAGLTISETREVLVQLYAYVGFPRSLNALNELMTVVQARKQRGIEDAPGREPSRAIPVGDELLAAGTANQTKISGAPVKGPVFEFAPVINRFLQTHLFGDIFERDNLDWQSRELATVGALAATPGVEPQLRSHMAASLRVGLSAAQLHQVTELLKKHGDAQTAERANAALVQALTASRK
jgi:alkylhydroperoxidase/carboxymuconolactone decarboxylase family protein YurZ